MPQCLLFIVVFKTLTPNFQKPDAMDLFIKKAILHGEGGAEPALPMGCEGHSGLER